MFSVNNGISDYGHSLNLLIFCQESLECCQSPVLARWGTLPQLGVTVQGELLQSNG